MSIISQHNVEDDKKPMFLMLTYMNPHSPLEPLRGDLRRAAHVENEVLHLYCVISTCIIRTVYCVMCHIHMYYTYCVLCNVSYPHVLSQTNGGGGGGG